MMETRTCLDFPAMFQTVADAPDSIHRVALRRLMDQTTADPIGAAASTGTGPGAAFQRCISL